MTSRQHASRIALPLLLLALLPLGVVACAGNESATTQKRMFVSTEEFKQGRSDGRRDASVAWSDDSAAWTWMWMMSHQYKQGYEQGWREGRAEAKFAAERDEAESLQEQ